MRLSVIKNIPTEAWIWLIGLAMLAIISPGHSHYSVCILHNLDFPYCPGCGLGRSISLLFRGEISHSFETHPLGIFAVLVLSHRIYFLINNQLKENGTTH
jgi:hypothetical protein